MKFNTTTIVLAATLLTVLSCQKMADQEAAAEYASADMAMRKGSGNTVGQVYTLSNSPSANKVLVYNRSADGSLSYVMEYSTGGKGTGGGLGNQGALALSGNNQWLFAVNAGSHSISSFRVKQDGLQLVSTVSSGGMQPISLTVAGDLLYVLNAGGDGNIAGFRIGNSGMLSAIAGSVRPLSSMTAGAAQISFVNEDKVVVITEKATNKIISYTIGSDGRPGVFHTLVAANPTPFGFGIGQQGKIFVSEAVGGAAMASTVSSYQVFSSGEIALVDGPVSAKQTAACWVTVTNNGKYLFATNTGSNTVSSFQATPTGKLSVKEAAVPSGMGPIDAALSNNSQYLYVLNAGDDSITAYAVSNDGKLSVVQTVGGVPDGATGLVAK